MLAKISLLMKSDFELVVQYQICKLSMDSIMMIAINILYQRKSLLQLLNLQQTFHKKILLLMLWSKKFLKIDLMYGTLLKFRMHTLIMEELFCFIANLLINYN